MNHPFLWSFVAHFPFAFSMKAIGLGILGISAGMILVLYWVAEARPGEGRGSFKALLHQFLHPGRSIARLEKVVCPHCQRGNGLLHPVYRKAGDQSWVEGLCTHCGGFVRAKLNP